MSKPFDRRKWLERPFRTPEGLVEIWLYEECWSANVHLVTEASRDETSYRDWMRRVFDCDPGSNLGGNSAAECSSIMNRDGAQVAVLITFPGKWQPTVDNFLVLSHECFHATSKILFSKGMKHNEETEEAFAYLQDSLLRRFIAALSKRPLPASKNRKDSA